MFIGNSADLSHDSIWAPISNKVGPWRMTLEMNGSIIADKTFNVFNHDEGQFWKRRGC
ncbi:DUF3859 domain-containing protein [Photobacterium leiognathi]|uniref:DUF3859 domain-containing protein n=1 Tax=Photobacterium leiognathi TaxID=553611 RepID=UPI002159A19E|nr:DUF3859 domain-containing protein [Photobacterium leiognathi]